MKLITAILLTSAASCVYGSKYMACGTNEESPPCVPCNNVADCREAYGSIDRDKDVGDLAACPSGYEFLEYKHYPQIWPAQDVYSKICVLKSPTQSSPSGNNNNAGPIRPFPTICNGQEICNRRYNDITFATAHNSYSHSNDAPYKTGSSAISDLVQIFTAGRNDVITNHIINLEDQWNRGFRAFMVDFFLDNGLLKFCHKNCDFSEEADVHKWLVQLKQLMANKNEVVTILVEPGEGGEPLLFHRALEATGLKNQVYSHQKGDAWSTLGEMISTNKNLVVMWQSNNADLARYGFVGQDQWFQNHWNPLKKSNGGVVELQNPESCNKHDGSKITNGLYVVNNWGNAGGGTPFRPDSEIANQPGFVTRRITMCWEKLNMRPNFLGVDWAELGDTAAGVANANKAATLSAAMPSSKDFPKTYMACGTSENSPACVPCTSEANCRDRGFDGSINRDKDVEDLVSCPQGYSHLKYERYPQIWPAADVYSVTCIAVETKGWRQVATMKQSGISCPPTQGYYSAPKPTVDSCKQWCEQLGACNAISWNGSTCWVQTCPNISAPSFAQGVIGYEGWVRQ